MERAILPCQDFAADLTYIIPISRLAIQAADDGVPDVP
jgi:hypothetical protein